MILAWLLMYAALEGCGGVGSKTVSFISLNDVYKLVGLTSELPYLYLQADVDYIHQTAASKCNGARCREVDGAETCGRGDDWEACFPLSFSERLEERYAKIRSYATGPIVTQGPCGGGNFSDEEQYGHMVDFAATYKWLKEEVEASGGLAVGTFAGDFIAPSYLAEMHRGKQLVEIMNHMAVDLANIGNHDIDFGLGVLKDQMGKSAFHYLNSNLQGLDGEPIQQPVIDNVTVFGNDGTYETSAWRRLPGENSSAGLGFAILDHGPGVKVCVLGTTDVDKMNWKRKKVDGFQRDIPAAIAVLRAWEAQNLGCNLRVALTHTRTGNDLNLFLAAESAGLHLDAIIAGHDHYAAFAELRRRDGGTTFVVKTGADGRIISKLTFDMSTSKPVGSLEIVPVVTGSCKPMLKAKAPETRRWFLKAEELFMRYAKSANDANAIALNVLYRGFYDTNIVRDGESRAVNMWLDLMRESLSVDVLFFQAGLVRQDMVQEFGKKAVMLSELFMLEEFPWGDDDSDARSSLFTFRVSVDELVTKTLPWLARQYWCNAPFNDANRIHMSGFILEMETGPRCNDPTGRSPVKSVTLVGGCHQGGTLHPVESSCCTSPACGRLWTRGGWDPRVSAKLKAERLAVATGQFCVPSKYKSHGGGFHDVGMSCPGAEAFAGELPWAKAPLLDKIPGAQGHEAPDFEKHGYLFKPAVRALLHAREAPLKVGFESSDACKAWSQNYEAASAVFGHCRCEFGTQGNLQGACGPGHKPRSNGAPRFFGAPDKAFATESAEL